MPDPRDAAIVALLQRIRHGIAPILGPTHSVYKDDELRAEIRAFVEAAVGAERKALEESVKLQSHYASLLNQYDGGERLQFADADAWKARLRAIRARAPRGGKGE